MLLVPEGTARAEALAHGQKFDMGKPVADVVRRIEGEYIQFDRFEEEEENEKEEAKVEVDKEEDEEVCLSGYKRQRED